MSIPNGYFTLKGGEPKDTMADDIDKIVGDEGGAGDKNNQQLEKDWQKITEGKYKTEADLAKAYKELEKKISEQGKKLSDAEQFATVISPILEEIRNDKEIFDKLDKKLRDKGNPEIKNDKDKKEVGDEVRTVASDLIIARFEEKYGITKLEPDEQKTIRQQLGDEIFEMTGLRLGAIDLRRLPGVLEKAYKLVDPNKSETQSDDDGSDGAIGSLKSHSGKGEAVLTSEEAKVAEKMGLTRDQYISGKKK